VVRSSPLGHWFSDGGFDVIFAMGAPSLPLSLPAMLWNDCDDDMDGGRVGYSVCGMISVGCVMDAEPESYVFLRHADLIP
jgi:hypothetical protein